MSGGLAESPQGVSKVHTTVIQKSWIEKNLYADMHAEEKVIGKIIELINYNNIIL
jgi:hypothetical protein